MQAGQSDSAEGGAYAVSGMPQWWRRVPLRARLLMLVAVASGTLLYLAEPYSRRMPPQPALTQAPSKSSVWDWLARSRELNAMSRPVLLGERDLVAVGADWVLDAGGQLQRERDGRWAPDGGESLAAHDLLSAHCAPDGHSCWAVDREGGLHRRMADKWFGPDETDSRWQAGTLWFAEDGHRGFGVDVQGRLLSSDDGGNSWHVRAIEEERAFSRLRFSADLRVGAAVGERGLLLISQDGGQSWRAGSAQKGLQLHSVAISGDGGQIWALAGQPQGRAQLLRSADAGRSWVTQELSGAAPLLHDLVMSADGRRGWILGDAGALLRSDDSGKSWQVLETGLSVALRAGYLQGERQRLVGDGGSLLESSDQGRAWRLVAGVDGRRLGRAVLSGEDGRQAWVAAAQTLACAAVAAADA